MNTVIVFSTAEAEDLMTTLRTRQGEILRAPRSARDMEELRACSDILSTVSHASARAAREGRAEIEIIPEARSQQNALSMALQRLRGLRAVSQLSRGPHFCDIS